MQDDPPARDGLDQALTAASAAHDLVERLSRELITQRTRAERLSRELITQRTRAERLSRELITQRTRAEQLSRELITQRTRAEQLDAELEALRATRLFRYTLRLRAAYGKLRKP